VKLGRGTETSDAPGWQGERRPNIGNIRGEREACPVHCSQVVFGCERQSLPKRQRAPPEDLRRLRMPIGNHVQQEVCAA
jgi:hypothetical protein